MQTTKLQLQGQDGSVRLLTIESGEDAQTLGNFISNNYLGQGGAAADRVEAEEALPTPGLVFEHNSASQEPEAPALKSPASIVLNDEVLALPSTV